MSWIILYLTLIKQSLLGNRDKDYSQHQKTREFGVRFRFEDISRVQGIHVYPQIYNAAVPLSSREITLAAVTINFEPDANYYSERQSIRPCKSRIDYCVKRKFSVSRLLYETRASLYSI